MLKNIYIYFLAYFDMVQHELFLCVMHGAVRAFEHWNFVIDDMLVKVCIEQGLQSEHSIAHGTFVDHPERKKKKSGLSFKTLPIYC